MMLPGTPACYEVYNPPTKGMLHAQRILSSHYMLFDKRVRQLKYLLLLLVNTDDTLLVR